MKMYVEIGTWVNVEEGGEVLGTSAQYEEAIKSVEKALGIMFYDYERDGSEYQGLRIVRVSGKQKLYSLKRKIKERG